MGSFDVGVILAGGQGTRVGRLDVLPKCLLPIRDQPILIREIEHVARAGAKQVVVSIAERYADIVHAVLARYVPPSSVAITCVVETSPLGAPRGLASLAEAVGGRSCVVILGDEYYGDAAPFDRLRELGAESNHMFVGTIRRSIPERIACNVVLDAAGTILRIRDKPPAAEIVGDVRWAGCTALGPAVFDLVAELVLRGNLPGPHIGDVFEALRLAGVRASALPFPELEVNINTPDDLLFASMVEAARVAPPPQRALLTRALEPLLQAYGLVGADLHEPRC